MCLYVYFTCVWVPTEAEEVMEPLELELWEVVSCPVSARSPTLDPLEKQVLLTTKAISPALGHFCGE